MTNTLSKNSVIISRSLHFFLSLALLYNSIKIIKTKSFVVTLCSQFRHKLLFKSDFSGNLISNPIRFWTVSLMLKRASSILTWLIGTYRRLSQPTWTYTTPAITH